MSTMRVHDDEYLSFDGDESARWHLRTEHSGRPFWPAALQRGVTYTIVPGDLAALVGRRQWVGPAVDAVLGWWLDGTDDEAMKEWWTTDEAPEAALELVHVVLQAIEDAGFRVSSQ